MQLDNKSYESDEIDLHNLYKSFVERKWVIATIIFIFTLIGLLISLIPTTNYEISTSIRKSQNSAFIKYLGLNEVIATSSFKLTPPKGVLVDADNVFELLISEMSDYEEVVEVLKNEDFVKDLMKDLSPENKRYAIIELAKKFIINNKNNDQEMVIKFNWHDPKEGISIIQKVVKKSLLNVKNKLKNNILQFVIEIESDQRIRINRLGIKMGVLLNVIKAKVKGKLTFLSEQSQIAKELGIESNLFFIDDKEKKLINKIAIYNSDNVAFYLRGFKAIDKEIDLILNRSDEENLLMAEGYNEYFDLKQELAETKSKNFTVEFLKKKITTLKKQDPKKWVIYDTLFSEVKSNDKSIPIIITFFVLGIVISVITVLISNIFKR